MTDEGPEPPVSGWVFTMFAVIFAATGWLALAVDDGPPRAVGIAVLALAGFLAAVGAISVGVEMGMRRASR